MLTQSEQRWLEERVLLPYYSCKYCTGYHNQSCNAFEPLSFCWNRLCENFDFEYFDEEVFLDVVEFSERVAVKLAVHHLCTTCPYPDGPNPRPCGWCLMKRARLQVEEEMNDR